MQSEFSLKLFTNDQELAVFYFKGFEAISRQFYGKIKLLSRNAWENAGQWITQNVCLELKTQHQRRYFNGYIVKASCSAFPNKNDYYELDILVSSWPNLFKDTQEFQIFENKTTLEILQELFKSQPFCQLDFSNLTKSYPALSYCVQYQESRQRFMQRLLNNAGIETYVKHTKNQHSLVLFDNPLTEIEEIDPVFFNQWQACMSLMPPQQRYLVKSSSLELRTNLLFHYREQAYRVLGVKHEVIDSSQSQLHDTHPSPAYRNLSLVIPAQASLPKKTYFAKPTIPGVQTAVVESISSHGIHLLYPWTDRTDSAGYPVPHLQLLADEEQHFQFSASPGMEAVVGYMHGDPEQPLVLAACYNAEQRPPFRLSANQTCCGFKHHSGTELCFDDTAGTEQLSLVTAQNYQQNIDLKQEIKLQGNYHQSIQKEAHFQAKHYSIEAQAIHLQAGQSYIKLSNDGLVLHSKHIQLN